MKRILSSLVLLVALASLAKAGGTGTLTLIDKSDIRLNLRIYDEKNADDPDAKILYSCGADPGKSCKVTLPSGVDFDIAITDTDSPANVVKQATGRVGDGEDASITVFGDTGAKPASLRQAR